MRLIDADELKPDVEKTMVLTVLAKKNKELYSQEAIDKAPTIEAEPVRHGEWAEKGSGFDRYFVCSECHTNTLGFLIAPDFCPHCGAKMDGGDSS